MKDPRIKDFDQWVKACNEKHNNKYTYLTDTRVLLGGQWKLEIVCPEHGSFFQLPAKHKFGQGCAVCSNNVPLVEPLDFVRTTWPHVEWVETFSDAHSKLRVNGVCPHHGKFDKLVTQLRGIADKGGEACPRCAKIKGGINSRVGAENWKQRIAEIFPDYKVEVTDEHVARDKVKVTCTKHGTGEAKLQDLVRGHGCMQCWLESGVSKGEKELTAFVVSLSPRFTTLENFNLTKPSVLGEYDVLDPREFDIAVTLEDGTPVFIDFHGMYFHGDKVKLDPKVHTVKLDLLEGTGIKYLQVFEDEWAFKQNIVKSRLKHILGVSDGRLYARNLELVEVTWTQARDFYDEVHIQGAGTPSKTSFALLRDGEIVACMSFAKPRFDTECDIELTRFASKESVVGGFSRLLKTFIKENPECKSILSYADRRWSEGEVYQTNGFEFQGFTKPNYAWYKNLKKISRYESQRHRLSELFNREFDDTMTEDSIMRSQGFWKVYDAGNSRWVLNT